MEFGEKSLLARKKEGRKISRRKFLLGTLAASLVFWQRKNIAKGLGEVAETIMYDAPPERRLDGKEIDGVTKEFTLDETPDGQWPILRDEPNTERQLGLIKPRTEGEGVEVYGITYAANINAADFFIDPKDNRVHYGKWIRLEKEVSLFNDDQTPKVDDEGKQKTAKGFVAETFVNFENNPPENP